LFEINGLQKFIPNFSPRQKGGMFNMISFITASSPKLSLSSAVAAK